MLRAVMVLAVAAGDLMQTAQETERTTSDLGLSLKRRGATDTYSAYIRTQQSKLDKVRTKIDAIDVGRQHQVKREFAKALAEGTAGLASLRGKTVLCLGARLGGEVRAFKALGAVALGIDLNPGRSNMDVVAGDFHALPFPDASFDYAYSNVLDHVFDRDRFAAEACRVVKAGGLFFASLYPGESKGGNDAWTGRQSNSLDNKDVFVESMRVQGFDALTSTEVREDMDLTHVGANVWHQVIVTLYFKRSDRACPPVARRRR